MSDVLRDMYIEARMEIRRLRAEVDRLGRQCVREVRYKRETRRNLAKNIVWLGEALLAAGGVLPNASRELVPALRRELEGEGLL